jgi:hypothetical protein
MAAFGSVLAAAIDEVATGVVGSALGSGAALRVQPANSRPASASATKVDGALV